MENLSRHWQPNCHYNNAIGFYNRTVGEFYMATFGNKKCRQKMRPRKKREFIGVGVFCSALLAASCTHIDVDPAKNQKPMVTTYNHTIQSALPTDIGTDLIARAVGNQHETHQLVNAVMEQIQNPLVAGNHSELLIDGPETFNELLAAIDRAQHNIHLETYIFADDNLGTRVKRHLVARAAQGVKVRVIYDAVGSMTTDNKFFDEMRQVGIEVKEYKPINLENTASWRINNRDHRKLMIIDGRQVFVGGVNISDTYQSSSASNPGYERGQEEGWRDTHLKISGPAAILFQHYFVDTWLRLEGNIEAEEQHIFPKIKADGDTLVSAVASHGEKDEVKIYASYITAIENSRKSIHITNGYFVPNERMEEALIAAVKRGVAVKLIVPEFSDSTITLAASQASFDDLLEGGVQIYLFDDALLHAKTAVFDSVVAMVGSSNLDSRSFLHNNELNAVVVDAGFGRELEKTFARDLAESKPLTQQQWQQRGLQQRAKELLGKVVSYWL